MLNHASPPGTLLHIARFLPTARNLLQLTNKRFNAKVIVAPSGGSGGGNGIELGPV